MVVTGPFIIVYNLIEGFNSMQSLYFATKKAAIDYHTLLKSAGTDSAMFDSGLNELASF